MFFLKCCADFHQGSSGLPINARGRQCVPSCFMFLITIKYFKPGLSFITKDLNEILIAGSQLYLAICDEELTTGFIDPEKLPVHVCYKQKRIFCTHSNVITGLIEETITDDLPPIYSSLESALSTAYRQTKTCVFIFKGISLGLYMGIDDIYVFDSHSRNDNGLSSPDGTCVLGVVNTLPDLCCFLRALCNSVGTSEGYTQFDIHLLSLSTSHVISPYVIHILESRQGFFIKVVKGKRVEETNTEESTSKRKKNDNLKKGRSLEKHIDDINISSSVKVVKGKRDIEEEINMGESTSKRKKIETLTKGRSLEKHIDDININRNDLVMLFEKLSGSGPDYVCTCCTQTYFSHFVKNIDNLWQKTKVKLEPFCTKLKSFGNMEWICETCLSSIKEGRCPKFWIHNGLQFPNKPSELEISGLEERLVSPRLPFMQLREMPRGGQVNMKGNVVNVPCDVSSTIKLLPRMLCENETIMLKLKRKLSYKHYIAFENIRPNKVFQAAKWLIENSQLFRNEGIIINENWLSHSTFVHSVEENEENEDSNSCYNVSGDDWTENDDRPIGASGNLDTCLQSIDFREFNQVLCVAPAEKNSPIGLYQDSYSEIFSFPSIYCGQPRKGNDERRVPLHYSDICKWELRNIDRRVALCVPNIFFKLKRLQIKQIKDKVSLAVRKCKAEGKKYTAGDILSPGFIDKLTMQDDGYRVLRTLRGSPPYWEAAKRDVFSMIRQLGIPTWFCSFSAAETKWIPLLKSLSKLVNGKILSLHDIQGLSWQEKCKLIKSDPVTCARYFQNRVQIFIKHVLKHPSNPIGVIQDYFYRVEFQQRGSPHIHMIIWVENAPIHGISSDQDIASFVSKYITCVKDSSIVDLVNYQTHRHAKTCRKHGKAICRFNFPVLPMPESLILYPIENSEERAMYAAEYENIVSVIENLLKTNPEATFSDVLAKLEIDYDTYVLILRSQLLRPKVFLKRSLDEIRINNYNSVLLRCWQANMDIQYILDPYSCVSYIVSYISKGQRCLSNLLQDACFEAKELDSDVRQQVRRIGNQFLSSVEVGAQEAAYLVLQMPLRKCTRDVIYVDTNKEIMRTSLIKPISELKDLPPGSQNIEMDNVLKRYKRRPKCLEHLCYADFASWYDLCSKASQANKQIEVDSDSELPELQYNLDHDDEILNSNDESGGNVIKFACGTKVRKRKQQKVIYSHFPSINQNREEYFRAKVMLYSNWRDEDIDLLCGKATYEECYLENQNYIKKVQSSYEKMSTHTVENILQNIDTDNLGGIIHREGQHEDLVDIDHGPSQSEELAYFNPGTEKHLHEDYDLGVDLGINRKQVCFAGLPSGEVNNEQFLQNVCCLNKEQTQFFYHVLHLVKTQFDPFYIFLSGGAGCGKSVLVRALYQALLKYFNHMQGEDPVSTKVLLCAPTGKAAHNIGGSTIHSAFCIPANQGFHFKPLDMQQLNTMRAHFHDLKVVIIDEISMVGRGMLNFINLRLQEVKGCVRPFGNVSVLAVGDLYQLKPVLDAWVFSSVFRKVNLQCIATNLWTDLFEFFELTEIMRQKDDHAFAVLLNRLREGKHTQEDLSLLETKQLTANNNCSQIREIPHLFCNKADVNAHNSFILSALPSSESIEISAVDSVSGDIGQGAANVILSRLPLDESKTMGLRKNLVLGIGLPVELGVNLDTKDGLTNGTPGVVRYFDFRVRNSPRCSIVWVEFEDQNIGEIWRTQYRHLYNENINLAWTPILEICKKFSFQYYKSYLITRRQFPLYLSSGKTIHKSQGSTLNEAVMHFGQRKIDHIHYVGLSRVTNLSGVHIQQLNSAKISVSSEVAAEMDRLRSTKVITNSIPDLSCFNQANFVTVAFQNCRSLKKHMPSIACEQNMLCADVIGFAETRLNSTVENEIVLDGFKYFHASTNKCAHGLSVFYKNHIDARNFVCFTHANIECALVQLEQDFVVGFIYCPPRHSTVDNHKKFLSKMFDVLEKKYNIKTFDNKLILMGDFNYDYKPNCRIAKLFREQFSFNQLVKSVTTDYGSCLDHIYCSLPEQQLQCCGTLESYYSDHKPVFIVKSF